MGRVLVAARTEHALTSDEPETLVSILQPGEHREHPALLVVLGQDVGD
jgi:hypothetical protein